MRKSGSVSTVKAPKKSSSKKQNKRKTIKTKCGGSPIAAVPTLLKSNKFLQAAPALINTVGILSKKGELGKILAKASDKKIAERSANYVNSLRSNINKAVPVLENKANNVKNRGNVFMNNINKLLGNKQVMGKVSGLITMAQNLKNNASESEQRQAEEILKQRSQQAQLLEQQRQEAMLLQQQKLKEQELERQRQVVEMIKQRRLQAQEIERQRQEALNLEQKRREDMLLEQRKLEAQENERQRQAAMLLEQQKQASDNLEMEKLILIEFLKELRKTKMSMVKIEKALIEMRQSGAILTSSDKQAICQIYSEISDKVRAQCNQPFINNPQACIERYRARFGINENTKRKALEIVSDTC